MKATTAAPRSAGSALAAFGQILRRLDAEQDVGVTRRLEHRARVETRAWDTVAAGPPMRRGACERRACGVGAFAQVAERRARNGCKPRCERTDLRILRMTLRDVAEQHERRRARQRLRRRAMRLGHADAFDGAREMRRDRRAGGTGRRGEHGREVRDERIGRRRYVRRGLEKILVDGRIQERDAGALARGLAHAMRDDRHFHAQVRADHEYALARIELGDAAAQERRPRVMRLIAEVALPQAVVDVVAAEVARDALQEIRLLERRAGAHERAQAAGAADLRRFSERADRCVQGVLPRRPRPNRYRCFTRGRSSRSPL